MTSFFLWCPKPQGSELKTSKNLYRRPKNKNHSFRPLNSNHISVDPTNSLSTVHRQWTPPERRSPGVTNIAAKVPRPTQKVVAAFDCWAPEPPSPFMFRKGKVQKTGQILETLRKKKTLDVKSIMILLLHKMPAWFENVYHDLRDQVYLLLQAMYWSRNCQPDFRPTRILPNTSNEFPTFEDLVLTFYN